MDYKAWMTSVENVLARSGRGQFVGKIDPKSCMQAFQAGTSPITFAGQSVLPLAGQQSITEKEWAAEVEKLFAKYRPDVPLIAIDPAGLYRAYLDGVTPAAFVSQQDLPFRPGSITTMPTIAMTASRSSGSVNPWAAFLLGLLLIGMGQMYNRQYRKAILCIIVGVLLMLLIFGALAPLLVIQVSAAVEAAVTAARMENGEIVDNAKWF